MLIINPIWGAIEDNWIPFDAKAFKNETLFFTLKVPVKYVTIDNGPDDEPSYKTYYLMPAANYNGYPTTASTSVKLANKFYSDSFGMCIKSDNVTDEKFVSKSEFDDLEEDTRYEIVMAYCSFWDADYGWLQEMLQHCLLLDAAYWKK